MRSDGDEDKNCVCGEAQTSAKLQKMPTEM